jgi:hypothetical protein
MEAIIRAQEESWNVSYELPDLEPSGATPSWWKHPLDRKLEEAGQLVIFRVLLFGGVLTVLARTFTMRRWTPNQRLERTRGSSSLNFRGNR